MVFLVFLALFSNEAFDLDELSTQAVLSAACIDDKVLFISPATAGIQPIGKIFHFDFEKNKAREIHDGRIQTSTRVAVMAFGDSFFLAELKLRIFFVLNPLGEFVETIPFQAFEGFDEHVRVVGAQRLDGHRVAVAFRDFEQLEILQLTLFDLDRRTSELVYTYTDQEPYFHSYWLPNGDSWFLVVPETGNIQLTNASFTKLKNLTTPREPVELVDKPWLKKMLLQKGASPFGMMLEGPIAHVQGFFVMKQTRFGAQKSLREMMSEKRIQQLLLGKKSVVVTDSLRFPLARYGDRTLVFDHTEKVFTLENNFPYPSPATPRSSN